MTIGDLISVVYTEMLALYGCADLAVVATAAIVNDLLTGDTVS